MENENGPVKVTESEEVTKSHGILRLVLEFTDFVPEFYQIPKSFANIEKISINLESPLFPTLLQNATNANFEQRYCHRK